MVRRLPTGPSRRHPRSNACCGVVNAMLGSEFCATSQLSLTAIRSTRRRTDGGAAGAHWHEIFTEYLSARDPYLNPSPCQAESFLIDDLGRLRPRGSNRRLNHHHSDAAFEDGGRDEAACLGRGPRIRQDDDGVADSQCRPRQRNDGGVIENLRRPAARSVARCNTSRVRSLAQLPRQLR
jgi:hypothetical protein